MNMKITLTIFTPTFNRAHLLPRVFRSLQKQNNFDFEWLIVDDGSTDGTSKLIRNFQERNSNFPIRYIYQENGGKHRAINRGVQEAQGDYILILDSDDEIIANAVSLVLQKARTIEDDPGIAGVVGRKIYSYGEMIGGKSNFFEIVANSLFLRYEQRIKGDLGEVFKTTVLKKFPFPEYKNEKFCPEALIWNRIAQKYSLLFFNEAFYIADYQKDGLTSSIVGIRMLSPRASMLYYSELASYTIPFKDKVKAGINFWRFSFNDKGKSFCTKRKQLPNILFLFLLPFGYIMYLRDKRI